MPAVTVECYAGYRGEQTPRRFTLRDTTIEVAAILDCWLAPDHRYFKTRGIDGCIYILRQEAETGGWEITLFDAAPDGGRSGCLPAPPGTIG